MGGADAEGGRLQSAILEERQQLAAEMPASGAAWARTARRMGRPDVQGG